MLHFYLYLTVPEDFLWSEWGPPPNCTKGDQIRTSMCGGLRRRLPNLPNRNEDDPPGTST